MPSIAVIWLPVTVAAMSDTGRPLTVISIPATPLTSTGVKSASGLAVAIVARAICAAPRMTTDALGRAGPPSARMTTSGSSSSMSRSKSPARAAVKNASTIARCCGRPTSGGLCPPLLYWRGVRLAPYPALRSGLPDLGAGAAGQLPGCLLRSPDELPDHAERHAEHVVQHECHALSGRQG